jgi:hypothetical protein
MTAASALAAIALLEREAALRPGEVPAQLGGREVLPGRYRIAPGEFLLRTDTGLGFHYRRGAGVTLAQTRDAAPGEIELWHHGSVYAAVAAINGLMPLHASAVAHDGRVFAFSGPSGAGKSTMAAGLGRLGLPLFCDDTLLLEISDPYEVWCLPGHKRLKLTEEALTLTGATGRETVGAMIDKRYAEPPRGTIAEPLPLAELIYLEDGPDCAFRPILGGERIARLNDDHYTAEFYAIAQTLDLPARFARFAQLAPQIAMTAFVRPFDAARFDASVSAAAARLRR